MPTLQIFYADAYYTSDGGILSFRYTVDFGSADVIRITPTVSYIDFPPGTFSGPTEAIVPESLDPYGEIERSVPVSFPTDPPMNGTFTLSGVYSQNGEDKTISASIDLPYG